MKKSAFISDVIFTFFTAFVLTLCLFRYLSFAFFPSLFLALVCGTLAAVANGAVLQSKRNAYFLKKSDETQKQKLLLHLALLSDRQKTHLLCRAFGQQNSTSLCGISKFASETQLYFVKFRLAPVSADEITALSRWKSGKDKILLCNEIEDAAARLCARLGIQVQTGEKVYQTLKENQALPDVYLGEEKAENKKLRRKQLCFAKRNSRRFLVGGTLILLTSLITPFPFYYFVFGTLLLVAALLIRMFGYS